MRSNSTTFRVSSTAAATVIVAFVLLLGALAGTANAQTITYGLGQGNPTTMTSGGAANCNRGWAFQVNVPNKAIYQLGCWVPDGTTQVKTMTLWQVTSTAPAITAGNILAQVNSTPGPGWCWTTLATPVVLTQGERYIVEVFTVTASYYYTSFTPPSPWLPGVGATGTPDILYLGMYYNAGPTASTFPNSLLSNYQYGVADIGYGDNQVTGSSLWVKDVATVAGGAQVGNNTLRVTLRNGGTVAFTNQNVSLEYSLNGAAGPWLGTQQFTIASLAPLADTTVDMTTTPWSVATIGNYNVTVRQTPASAIGTVNIEKTVNFRPDADITVVSTGTQDPQLGPNTVEVTVRNNGTWNLNTVTIPLSYNINGGAWTTDQNFTPTTLSANGNTQVFQLTSNPWNVAAVGSNVTLNARITTVITGDPDATDTLSRLYPQVGVPGVLIAYSPAPTGSNAIPLSSSYTNCKFQTSFAASVLGGQPMLISSIGFPFSAAVNGTIGNLRIRIGETSLTTLTATYATNFNVPAAPAVTVYDAPLTIVTTAADGVWQATFTTPYFYSAQNRLLVELYVVAGVLSGNSRAGTLAGTERVYTLSGGDSATGTVGASYGIGVFMRVLAATTGTAAIVQDAGLTTPLLATGNNTVTALVRNFGTTALTAPLTLRYSIDGGVTFPANQTQTFTPTTLGLQQTEVFTFTQAWAVATPASATLKVELFPTIGTIQQSFTKPYLCDPDITLITTTPAAPILGNNQVSVTVRNNGGFNLNGVTIPLRFTATQGASYTTLSAVPTTLGTANSTEVFTFASPWTAVVPFGNTLTASIFPQLTGDPDAADSLSTLYSVPASPQVGNLGSLTTQTATNAIPFSSSYTSCKFQQDYTPLQLGSNSGEIVEMGFSFGIAVTNQTWTRVRIELGETTLTTLGATFASNYNVPAAPPVVVYDQAMTLNYPTAGAANFWYVPLSTPFTYSGTNRLLVTLYVQGAPVGATVYSTTLAGNTRVYAVNLGDVITGTVGASYGTNASFRFLNGATGASVGVKTITLNAAGTAAVGSNVINAVVRNYGTVAQTGAVALEYSTNNGGTWSAPQSFTPVALGVGQEETYSFTTPITIASFGAVQVLVRVNPTIGELNKIKQVIFAPDLDITAGNTGIMDPQVGNNIVQVTVRNNGRFNLQGVTIPLRYQVGGTSTWVTQSFTGGAALATAGASETLSFTTPWSIAAVGAASLTTQIFPVLTGDPDAVDSMTTAFPDAGIPGATVNFAPGTGGNAIPFSNSYTNCKYQTAYTVADVGGSPAFITQIGFPFSAAVNGTITSVRIELGETTLATLTATYDTNYNVVSAPKTTVYNGPLTLTNVGANAIWRATLATPYFYSAQNKLLVTIYVVGGISGANVLSGSLTGYERVYALNTGDVASGTVGTLFATNVSFRVLTQVTGSALLAASCDVGGSMAVIGNNTVSATIRNLGTLTHVNVPTTLEYSTDGGVTWPANQSQTFTPTALAPLAAETFTFTTAWAITALPATSFDLRVRINPAVGTVFPQTTTKLFRVDADISAVNTGGQDPQLGPNTPRIVVKNNGNIGLNGVTFTSRYTVDAGANYTTQVFTPTSLNTLAATQTFSFTTPFTLAAVAPVTLTCDITPVVTGDPDATDAMSRVYPEAGTPGSAINFLPIAATTGNAIPFSSSYTNCKFQTAYNVADVGGQPALITQIGFPFSAAVNGTFGQLRIEFGETNLPSLGATYDANYNVTSAPKTTVYDGALQLTTTTAGQLWRVPLTTPYFYSAQNRLLVTIYVVTGLVGANSNSSTLAGYERVYALNTGDAASGTVGASYGMNVTFRLFAQVSGQALFMQSAGVNGAYPGAPAVGANVVRARVKNMGDVDMSTVPFTMEYSTDGGTTWGVTETFTRPGFTPLAEQDITFTQPWTAALGTYNLRVRINPAVNAMFPQLAQATYANDLDITAVSTTPAVPQIGQSNAVAVTVRNNGNFNLNGVSIPLRWSVNAGITATSQTFTGSTLATKNATETFTFTNGWTPVIGNYYMFADIFPQSAGDPDPVDLFTRAYTGIGAVNTAPSPPLELMTTAVEVSSNAASGYPINTFYHDQRMESIYLASELTAAGLTSGSAISQIEIKCSSLPGQVVPQQRIRMQHTTAATVGTTYTSTGWTVHYGPQDIQINAFSINGWYTFVFTTPFTWNGSDNVRIDFLTDGTSYISGGGIFLRNTTAARSLTGFSDSGFTYPFDTMTPTAQLHVPSLRVVATNTTVASSPAKVTGVNINSNYSRVNGQKDIYKGETIVVDATFENTYGVPVELTEVWFGATTGTSSIPVSGISFTQLPAPVPVAANATVTVSVNMPVAINAVGNDITVTVTPLGGLARDPAAATTNPIMVVSTAAVKTFKLFDGPAPAPFFISTLNWAPASLSLLFYQELQCSGGTGTYVWNVATDSPQPLPTSLVLSPNGSTIAPANISGTPVTGDAGTRQVKMRATDGIYETTKTFTLLIASSPLDFPAPVFTDATEGTAYNFTLMATGGSNSYAFSVAAASVNQLPTGLSLSPVGVISGTPQPLTQGSFTITFRVNDGFSTVDATATLVVLPGPLLWVGPSTMEFRETVQKSIQLLAAGGVAARNYAVATSTAQQLPAGLSLNALTGVVSGAPNASTAGTYNVTFNVTDGVTTLPYTVAVTVLLPLPFVIQTDTLNVGFALAPYTSQLTAVGGAEVYSWSVLSSTPTLPASLTLDAQTGEITGVPQFGHAGRYTVVIRCTDTANRILDKTFNLSVLQAGGLKVELTEVNVGATDYLEVTCRGGLGDPGFVDISGWNVSVWTDSTTPTTLAWNAFPTGTLLFGGSVVTINGGGTAGGAFPSFSTGTDLTLADSSNVAVALWDRFGNVIDVVSIGNLDVSTLLMNATVNAGITTANWTGNVQNGVDNYSRTAPVETDSGNDWARAAAGTAGSFNPTLPVPALEFVLDTFPSAQDGQAYFRQVVASGGVAPYTYSLTAPAAPWLSINAQTGVLSGTPATADVGSFPVTVTVTDAGTIPASTNSTETLEILGATANAAHGITLGTASASSANNTSIAIPVTLTGANAAVGEFEFRVALTTDEIQLSGITLGNPAALAEKIAVQWKRDGVNTYTVVCFDLSSTPQAIASGTVLTLNFKVQGATGNKATAGTYNLTVSEPAALDTSDAPLSMSATSGSITLSDFKAQDVNRNGQVNVVDVQLCVNIILQIAQPAYQGQGDANKSGSVNVVDVQNIVNCILTPTTCPN